MILFVPAALLARATSVSKDHGRRRVVALTKLLCRVLLRVLNIRCEIDSLPRRVGRRRPMLILPNHASYVDVIVLNAHFPSVFVTSREIQETPVLGWISRAGGCAFVERRNIWQVRQDVVQLAEILNAGHDVTLFPEGSTSDGHRLLPFKKTLLESAVRSSCRVVPVCLKYQVPEGVAWYGDMTFFPHLWQLMRIKSIEARVSVLGEVAFRGHKSRKRLAQDVQSRIFERFHREASPSRNARNDGAG